MTIHWKRFAEIVRDHQSFLLMSHIRPDCDALGSLLGMAKILLASGKTVHIVNGHGAPPNLAFIDPEGRIKALGEDLSIDEIPEHDVLIVLDTSAWAQLGPMGDVVRSSTSKKIVVDHHVSGDDLGTEPFKDTQAEATGALVVQAADALGVPLTPAMAMPLFAAVATDTGWFRFGSTTSETYRVAARLIDAGANPAQIYRNLYERNSMGRVRLRGMILTRIASELDGRLVHTYVRKTDFEQTGALPSDTEDVVNMALEIAGTEAAVIFVEQMGGGFKISFRSRSEMDCSRVAEQFSGGGHRAAAGAFVRGEFEEVQTRVLDAVRHAMPSNG
ncbi:MAG: bifunctional oligoribonuclease/PAP phosphatase NrnA [Pirellulaceae bacterium]